MTPFTFTYRGLTFGEGTDILVEAEIGGLRSVSVESGSVNSSHFHGALPGRHLARGVNVVFPLRVIGRMNGNLSSLLDHLNAAFQPHRTTEFPLLIRLFEDEWLIYGRPIARREVVAPRSYSSGAVPYKVALERTDPHWYSAAVRSVTIPVYSIEGGGIDLPSDLPWDLGAATQGVGWAFNGGNADAYPLLRFQRPAGVSGAVNAVTVINATSGDEPVTIRTPLVAGQTLVADFFAYVRAVRDVDPINIDGASRLLAWEHPQRPLRLRPGWNQLRFIPEGAGGGSVVATATFRDTSL